MADIWKKFKFVIISIVFVSVFFFLFFCPSKLLTVKLFKLNQMEGYDRFISITHFTHTLGRA